MLPTLGNKLRGLTRRELLFRGALATGGLVVAGLVVRVLEGPAPGRRVLSEREARTTASMIDAAFGDGGMPAGDAPLMLAWIDDYLAGTAPEVRLLYKSIVQLLEEQALLTRGARFSSLDRSARAAELRAWELTPLWLRRSAFQSVKLIIGMAYFELPEAMDAVGYYVGCAPPHLSHKSRDRHGQGTS